MQLDDAVEVYRRVVEVAQAGSIDRTGDQYQVSVPFNRTDRVPVRTLTDIESAATKDGTEARLCFVRESTLFIT